MVKIYLIKNKKRSKEFIEISFWSMIKAYVISAFTIIAIIYGFIFIIGLAV